MSEPIKPVQYLSWKKENVEKAVLELWNAMKAIEKTKWDELDEMSRRGALDWKLLYAKFLEVALTDKASGIEEAVRIIALTIRRGTRADAWTKYQNEQNKPKVALLFKKWDLKTGQLMKATDLSAMRVLRVSGTIGAYVAVKLVDPKYGSCLGFLASLPMFPTLFQGELDAAHHEDIFVAWVTMTMKRLENVIPAINTDAQWIVGQEFIYNGVKDLLQAPGSVHEVWVEIGKADGVNYVKKRNGVYKFAADKIVEKLRIIGESAPGVLRAQRAMARSGFQHQMPAQQIPQQYGYYTPQYPQFMLPPGYQFGYPPRTDETRVELPSGQPEKQEKRKEEKKDVKDQDQDSSDEDEEGSGTTSTAKPASQ